MNKGRQQILNLAHSNSKVGEKSEKENMASKSSYADSKMMLSHLINYEIE